MGRRAATSFPNRRRPTTTGRSSGASSATSTGSSRSIASASTTSRFETDYPHTDSTWPHTKEVAEKMFAGLDDETIYKIVRGNAIRMLHLDLD